MTTEQNNEANTNGDAPARTNGEFIKILTAEIMAVHADIKRANMTDEEACAYIKECSNSIGDKLGIKQ